jgi:hypothetical protein
MQHPTSKGRLSKLTSNKTAAAISAAAIRSVPVSRLGASEPVIVGPASQRMSESDFDLARQV